MKKKYEKPLMYAETFKLMEHISKNCVIGNATGTPAGDKYSCSYTDGTFSIFMDGVTGCLNSDYDEAFDGSLENYLLNNGGATKCYNAFSNGQVFAS